MASDRLRNLPEIATPRGSGPVVWAAIIAVTCMLLFFLQKMLWLVVPALLALILYYVLFPPMQALIYRGLSRDTAATWVIIGFLWLVAALGIALAPWVADHLADWQNTLFG
ncbi:MAG TPA: hypothetical protein VJ001_00360, partial [Rhodocyclaceae bacterium]|nr:hypothetical protein [Rhodocyclaceae bacterium]